MRTTKIAISIEKNLLMELDNLVVEKQFTNRSQAIQLAVKDKLFRLRKNRLALECEKLDIAEEREIAESGFDRELEEWPEY